MLTILVDKAQIHVIRFGVPSIPQETRPPRADLLLDESGTRRRLSRESDKLVDGV